MALNIEDVQTLVKNIDLEDIFCQEERGRALKWTEEELAGRKFPQTTSQMGIQRQGEDTFLFRFRYVFTDQEAEYVADWVALFQLPEPADVTQELLEEFAEKVAFFSVYPFLRASIYGSASRLNKPVPVLGIVRQGQFQRGETVDDEETRAAFADVKSELLEAEATQGD